MYSLHRPRNPYKTEKENEINKKQTDRQTDNIGDYPTQLCPHNH